MECIIWDIDGSDFGPPEPDWPPLPVPGQSGHTKNEAAWKKLTYNQNAELLVRHYLVDKALNKRPEGVEIYLAGTEQARTEGFLVSPSSEATSDKLADLDQDFSAFGFDGKNSYLSDTILDVLKSNERSRLVLFTNGRGCHSFAAAGDRASVVSECDRLLRDSGARLVVVDLGPGTGVDRGTHEGVPGGGGTQPRGRRTEPAEENGSGKRGRSNSRGSSRGSGRGRGQGEGKGKGRGRGSSRSRSRDDHAADHGSDGGDERGEGNLSSGRKEKEVLESLASLVKLDLSRRALMNAVEFSNWIVCGGASEPDEPLAGGGAEEKGETGGRGGRGRGGGGGVKRQPAAKGISGTTLCRPLLSFGVSATHTVNIPVFIYKAVKSAKLPTATAVSKSTGAPIAGDRQYFISSAAEGGNDISAVDRVRAYRYASKVVEVTEADDILFQVEKEQKELKVLGSLTAEKYAQNFPLNEAAWVVPAAKDEISKRAFAALCKALTKTRRALVCRYVARANDNPKIVQLTPLPPLDDETGDRPHCPEDDEGEESEGKDGSKKDRDGRDKKDKDIDIKRGKKKGRGSEPVPWLLLNRLPFREDMRLSLLYKPLPQPSAEQQEAMLAFVAGSAYSPASSSASFSARNLKSAGAPYSPACTPHLGFASFHYHLAHRLITNPRITVATDSLGDPSSADDSLVSDEEDEHTATRTSQSKSKSKTKTNSKSRKSESVMPVLPPLPPVLRQMFAIPRSAMDPKGAVVKSLIDQFPTRFIHRQPAKHGEDFVPTDERSEEVREKEYAQLAGEILGERRPEEARSSRHPDQPTRSQQTSLLDASRRHGGGDEEGSEGEHEGLVFEPEHARESFGKLLEAHAFETAFYEMKQHIIDLILDLCEAAKDRARAEANVGLMSTAARTQGQALLNETKKKEEKKVEAALSLLRVYRGASAANEMFEKYNELMVAAKQVIELCKAANPAFAAHVTKDEDLLPFTHRNLSDMGVTTSAKHIMSDQDLEDFKHVLDSNSQLSTASTQDPYDANAAGPTAYDDDDDLNDLE